MQLAQNPLEEQRTQREIHAMIHPFAQALATKDIKDETQLTPALLEFVRLHSKGKVIDFNPNWANGTGYFNNAVRGEHAPKDLDFGTVYSFNTPDLRQGFILGTPAGNIVVFNRYSNRREIIAANMPRTLEIFFIQSRPLTGADLQVLGGTEFGFPIGQQMKLAAAYEERRKKYEAGEGEHPDLDGWKEVQA